MRKWLDALNPLLFFVALLAVLLVARAVFTDINEKNIQKFADTLWGKTLPVTLESITETRYGWLTVHDVQNDRGFALVAGSLKVPPPIPACTISAILEAGKGYIIVSWKCPGEFLPPERLKISFTNPPDTFAYSIYPVYVQILDEP